MVRCYLNNGSTLKRVAVKFHVNYRTVHKWIRLYKEQGEVRLLSSYKRPWNRVKKELEHRIAFLKEKEPTITLKDAQKVLHKEGIKISIKGIWGIWKRYGYAGFNKRKLRACFPDQFSWTKEATEKIKQAKELFRHGDIRHSAEVLNSIPALPENNFILQIPDSFLNLRRRIEKIALSHGKGALPDYLYNIKRLCGKCKKRKLYYSNLRLAILESVALSGYNKPIIQLRRIKRFESIFERKDNRLNLFEIGFSMLILKGVAYAKLSQIKKASDIARHCHMLLRRRKYIPLEFMYFLGILYIHLEDFRKAEYWYLRSWARASEKEKAVLKNNLADIAYYKGDYKKSISLLKDIRETWGGHESKIIFSQAMWYVVRGIPDKAISLSTRALLLMQKKNIDIAIMRAYFIMASAYCSLGESAKARNILKRLMPFAEKRLKRATRIFKILLSDNSEIDSRVSSTEDFLATVKLAHFLKKGNYSKALSYAKKKYLMTDFYRDILFFPELIIKALEKGKSTGLPKPMLRLPIFNKEIPVYHIRFLGNLIIYKNEKYLKFGLPPNDIAFIINLALKAGEPKKKILLDDLYSNFWGNSAHQASNLSHLLVRIKKAFRIPTHLLEISRRGGEPVLVNRGIHFITDYAEFEQLLTTAQALEWAGEWAFARKEYLRAFRLFRGEPFKKMYDPWSENMRRVILNKLETEGIHFARSCLEHGNKKNVKKVLEKVAQIIPGSEEIRKMVK
jgi:transposase